jgi:amino acid transporter
LGIPTFVIACLLISYHLKNKYEWNENKKTLLLSAHLTWMSLVLVMITMIVMIVGFKNAGIAIGPGQKPPTSVPDGVIAIVGYANRILIVAFIYWLILVSNNYLKISKAKA